MDFGNFESTNLIKIDIVAALWSHFEQGVCKK